MKGCGLALLADALLFVAVAAAAAWCFMSLGAGPLDALGPSILCALPSWIGVKLLLGIRQPIGEKKMLERSTERPSDGQLTAISGTMHASAPLSAPFSGTPCAAFQYTILAVVGRGKHRTIAPMYEGTAITPSTIRSTHGNYRLLAVPKFDFESELLDCDVATRNARTLIANVSFEKPGEGRSRTRLRDELTDDDGAYRFDIDRTSQPLDLEDCRFEEFLVKQGERVTVFGRFSAERGGIVADPNWAHVTRIMKGDAETIIAALRARIKRYLIGGVLFAAAGIALLVLLMSSE